MTRYDTCMRTAIGEHTFTPSRVGLHAGILCGVAENPNHLVAGEHAAVQRLVAEHRVARLLEIQVNIANLRDMH